ncbi:protein shisa-3-like [Ptychodera flava]|uniref:protein shisa-3-like n=1 Tax=Ptychodera flava TaxID=63121 RepID=UPI003969C802
MTKRTPKMMVLISLSLVVLSIGGCQAERCTGYYGPGGTFWNGFDCPGFWDSWYERYCCGSCTYKFCCDHENSFDQDDCEYSDYGSESSYYYDDESETNHGWLIILYIVSGLVVFILSLLVMACVCCHYISAKSRSATTVIQTRQADPHVPMPSPRTSMLVQTSSQQTNQQAYVPQHMSMEPPGYHGAVPPPPAYYPPENYCRQNEGAGPSTKAPLPL